MSLYLFLLVADVLQTLIKQDGGVRHPLVADMPCPVLQYADDTLILLRGKVVDVCRLKLLLDQFSDAPGLCIDYNKSTMVPMNMSEELTDTCKAFFGCRQEGSPKPTSVYRYLVTNCDWPLSTRISAVQTDT